VVTMKMAVFWDVTSHSMV